MALVTYQGNCHCGENRFQLIAPELGTVLSCDCDICHKMGYMNITIPQEMFEVKRGCGELTTYSSTSGSHKFCARCGTGLFVNHGPLEDEGELTVNVRSLSGINPFSLDPVRFCSDASGQAISDLLNDSNTALSSQDLETIYTGRCICGLVSLEATTLPIKCVEIKEDNCSICVRNAFIGIYLPNFAVIVRGREFIQNYTFGRGFNGHPFCKVCGAHLFMDLYGPPKEVVQEWPQARQDFVKKMLDVRPVNVRTLEDIKIEELNVVRSDEGTEGYFLDE